MHVNKIHVLEQGRPCLKCPPSFADNCPQICQEKKEMLTLAAQTWSRIVSWMLLSLWLLIGHLTLCTHTIWQYRSKCPPPFASVGPLTQCLFCVQTGGALYWSTNLWWWWIPQSNIVTMGVFWSQQNEMCWIMNGALCMIKSQLTVDQTC